MSTDTVINVRRRDRPALLADPNFVYVGRTCWGWRGSVFANPYTVKMWGHNALAYFCEDLAAARAGRRVKPRPTPQGHGVVKFNDHFYAMVKRLPELRGKVLGCWCGEWKLGEPTIGCHACELALVANGSPQQVNEDRKAKPFTEEWPRLSVTLTGPKSPVQCQGCGATSVRKLARWQEHDQADQREPIIVVLCDSCSSKLIEPHPRLYRQLDWNEPFAGAMLICWECTRRDGVTCISPLLLRNGGPGLPLPAPDTTLFIDGVRNGRRFGERRQAWSKPTENCVGKTLAPSESTGSEPS